MLTNAQNLCLFGEKVSVTENSLVVLRGCWGCSLNTMATRNASRPGIWSRAHVVQCCTGARG